MERPAGLPRAADGGKALQRRLLFVTQRGGDGATGPLLHDALGETFANAYVVTAAQQAAAPGAAAGAPGPHWRFLGPTAIPNGQTYGANRDRVSGRVGAIAVDPTDGTHVLVGAAGGGVWESHDGGGSWSARTDDQPTLTVGALAFDPSTPTTVYAATGEGNWYSWLGAGLLVSSDGGTTWSVQTAAPFVGQGFYGLVVDPANGAHLLGATTGGLYESSDSGASWTATLAGTCWAVSLATPGGAGAEALAAQGDGLHASADAGTTWGAVALPGAPATWDRLAVAHAPSDSRIAYAFGSSAGTGYLYGRDTTGAWQAITTPADLQTGQAWYDWYAVVAPDNPTQVYLGAIDLHRGDGAGGAWTWTNLSSKATGDSIHPDQHWLSVDPGNANTIYAGSDGGLFRSPDRGISWQALNDGLGIAEVEYLAQDSASASWLLCGTQDNGSLRWTGTLGWEHVADGDGGDCTVDEANPATVFHTYYSMGMERSTSKGDNGSWTWIGPNVAAGYGCLFYPPVAGDNSVIAQAGQSVFVSIDDGTTWIEVALPTGIASTLAIANGNALWAGTTSGGLYRLDRTSAGWSPPTALASPRAGAYLSDLWVDPTNTARIWTTSTSPGGGRVFRSDDGGATWNDMSGGGLTALPITAIEVDPTNASRAWVAADLGVWESLDAGASWSVLGTGLPNALVGDLLFNPTFRLLRAGLRNRGTWEIAV